MILTKLQKCSPKVIRNRHHQSLLLADTLLYRRVYSLGFVSMLSIWLFGCTSSIESLLSFQIFFSYLSKLLHSSVYLMDMCIVDLSRCTQQKTLFLERSEMLPPTALGQILH